MASEFVADASALLIDAMRQAGIGPEICGEVAKQWQAQVIRNWSGDRPYIGAMQPERLRELSRRDAAIVRDWQAGERVDYLMRKYGLGRSRVFDILRLSRAASTALP